MSNLDPLNYLDEAMLDLAIIRATLYAYSNEYQWQKFIRNN